GIAERARALRSKTGRDLAKSHGSEGSTTPDGGFVDNHENTHVSTAEAVLDNGSFGNRTIRFETGRLARQAAGSVAAFMGDTMLLSATTASKSPKEQFDFFPLTVDV